MAAALDLGTIRNSPYGELSAYFRAALDECDPQSLSSELLSALATESIPPLVFSVWLSTCHEPVVLKDALWQEHSIAVRQIAIRRFGKWLRSNRLMDAWSAVGGTAGLLQFLAQASVHEVTFFCKTAAKTSTSRHMVTERRNVITELLKGLALEHFQDAAHRTTDPRPLLSRYCELLPACHPDMVQAWMKNDHLPTPDASRLLRAHPTDCQEWVLETVDADHEPREDSPFYFPLLAHIPPELTEDSTISQSMAFSIELLSRINASGTTPLNAFQFADKLALPLLRRLFRRRCRSKIVHKVLGLLGEYVQKFDSSRHMHFYADHIFSYAIRLWNRKPLELREPLAQLLTLAPSLPQHFRSILHHLRLVCWHLRYQLLDLMLRNVQAIALDLQDEGQLGKCETLWPVEIFLALPEAEARSLLERLFRSKPDGNFLDYSRAYGLFESGRRDDHAVLLLYLSRGEAADNLEQAQVAIELWKNKAATSREQVDRAYWAKYTILSAIASGDLDLFRDVLLWARRFNKDALTVKELYAASVLLNDQAISMLCGIPERPNRVGVSLEQVRTAVMKGNATCELLFETACMGISEPSFWAPGWKAIRRLFANIVQVRLDRVNTLQQVLMLSDNMVYDTIWHSTVETCLALEKMGHGEGRESLQYDNVAGPLWLSLTGNHDLLVLNQPSKVSLRFLDQVAELRESLWRRLRSSRNANVITLQAPWPKGLPVQLLVPVTIPETEEGYEMPYILQRATETVFVDPGAAFTKQPETEEMESTIGPFVDSWSTALTFFVNSAPRGPARRQRADQAWNHAIRQLSGPRLSRNEALRFWESVFARAAVDISFIDLGLPKKPDAVLPQTDDPSHLMEWNPDPDPYLYLEKTRGLERVALDCLLEAGNISTRVTLSTPFRAGRSFTVPSGQPSLWDVKDARRLSTPRVREALIASALLYIEDKTSSGASLLANPFPATGDPRYPAMFLDDEFLERKDLYMSQALGMLQKLKASIPPTLLLRLVHSVISSSRDPQRPYVSDGDAFAVLKILAESDRPHLALDLIKDLVINRPESSSWHRHFVMKGLFDRVSAAHARGFIASFVSDIADKLRQQSSVFTNASETRSTSVKPLVKVTTVKMLAQLISNTNFVDEGCAVSALIELLMHARHIDIRCATIEALLKRLTDSRNQTAKADVFRALEQHGLPLASAINERQLITEDDWLRAEREGTPPEVYMERNAGAPGPILLSLVNACIRNGELPADERRKLLHRIVAPALWTSAANNRRWMAIFLRKHGFDLDPSQLPLVPTKPKALTALLYPCTEWLEDSIFQMHAAFVMANLDRPLALQKVNEAILSRKALRDSNEGQHWLSLWNLNENSALTFGTVNSTDLLKNRWASQVPNGLTYRRVQEQSLREAETLLRHADETFQVWNRFQRLLARPRSGGSSEEGRSCWQEYCRPVVQEIVDVIGRLRTPEWQADPHRKPAVLPDTFPLRLWLLPFPTVPWLDRDGQRLNTFVAELSALIDELAGSQRLYHDRFTLLTNSAGRIFNEDKVRVAVQLGSASQGTMSRPSLADLMRIELADTLLREARQPQDDATVSRAKDMVLGWRASADEDIRMHGLGISRDAKSVEQHNIAWLNDI